MIRRILLSTLAVLGNAGEDRRAYFLHHAILGGPAVGDLDRDGYVEVIAADYQGKLSVWNHDGTSRPGFPVSTNAAYSFTHRSERDRSTPDDGRHLA